MPSTDWLRLGNIRAGPAMNSGAQAQLPDIALERLDPLVLLGRRIALRALIPFRLRDPVVQRLRRTPSLVEAITTRCET